MRSFAKYIFSFGLLLFAGCFFICSLNAKAKIKAPPPIPTVMCSAPVSKSFSCETSSEDTIAMSMESQVKPVWLHFSPLLNPAEIISDLSGDEPGNYANTWQMNGL